jgi:hypothetical protein
VVLWFAGLSAIIVWAVFQSPAVDFRRVMLGSLLPLADLAFGVHILHTLAAPVLVMAAVMLLNSGKPLRRRAWLGIPIGMLLHQVLDGVWANAELFWWPFAGGDLTSSAPELERPLPILLALEAVGAVALLWLWGRFGLDDPEARRTFVRTGQMDRSKRTPKRAVVERGPKR